MKLNSLSFENNADIPVRFTGEGQNVSPALKWSGVPAECQTFALICEDPDAPQSGDAEDSFVHWLIFNISPNVTYLPEGIPHSEDLQLPIIAQQGMNSFGNMGYDGPFPPSKDQAHHYQFTLYALSNRVEGAISDKNALLKATSGNILAQATLVGLYQREAANEEEDFASGF